MVPGTRYPKRTEETGVVRPNRPTQCASPGADRVALARLS